jgi:DNA topoisomerase IB
MALSPAEVPAVIALARRHARASGLIYVSDTRPGISRDRRGKGFRYLKPNHRPVSEPEVLERIRKLAIPPAYTDVWICPEPRGHLQATGRDARHRKQYRYHARWRATRDDGKFTRMLEFGAKLPKLRKRLKQDLALPGLPRNKVLAVVVTLLDDTLIRVGNEEYARTNRSFGLTTLRDQHVRFLKDGRASFCFRGKGGKQHDIVLDDRRLARIIKRAQQLPGQLLFQYLDDDDGQRQPIDSGMVNEYLHEIMDDEGVGFTAKDFRTWGATVRAIAYLACQKCEGDISDTAFNKCIVATAKEVSAALGNTPTVCRKSYINPVVFTAWRTGVVDRLVPARSLSTRQMERVALKVLTA